MEDGDFGEFFYSLPKNVTNWTSASVSLIMNVLPRQFISLVIDCGHKEVRETHRISIHIKKKLS